MKNGSGKAALREVVVECPGIGPVRMREPRVRDYMRAAKITDEQERTLALLSAMVVTDQGEPLGEEGVLDLPVSALIALSAKIGELLGNEEGASPLVQTSGSSTASPLQ